MLWLGVLAKQLVGRDSHRRRQPFHRRDFRVAFAALDPADLRCVDAAACRDLFLRQPTAFPSTSKVPPKVARHAWDRLCSQLDAP